MSRFGGAAWLAGAAGDQPAGGAGAGPKLDGKWLVVYAEKDGKPVNAWEQQQVTAKGGVLSFEEEGKMHAYRLKFGPKNAVTASAVDAAGGEEQEDAKKGEGSQSGVYIAGRDYFCLSLGGGEGKKGSFILILRRQAGAGKDK